jgi:hypothetical protein
MGEAEYDRLRRLSIDELTAEGWTFNTYDSESALWYHPDRGGFFVRPWKESEMSRSSGDVDDDG